MKKAYARLGNPVVPRLPASLRPLFRPIYTLHFAVIAGFRNLLIWYRGPLLQSRCASFGQGVKLDGKLPFIHGPVEVHIGNHVSIGGNLVVISGHVCEERPRLILKDYCELGWGVILALNKEIVIEEHARVSYDCRISDSDGHPREMDLRNANQQPDPKDVRPVHVGPGAWIGNGSHIMKGVTIAEGAVVGANSVVISDIPAYALALGNPAQVFIRGFGKPSTAKRSAASQAGDASPDESKSAETGVQAL